MVPVVSVALIIVGLIIFWKKRKARKAAEEERKQEIEEYQFHPNNDPTFPAVGLAASSPGKDGGAGAGAAGGYRGWGSTSGSRKLSTTLSSGAGGMTASDGSRTAYGHVSPVDDGAGGGGAYAGYDHRPGSGGDNRQNDLDRGPSNASSAYSAGNRSDLSDETPPPQGAPLSSTYYNDDGNGAYYGAGAGGGGGSGGAPVIRDVQARRNTHIETPSVFPPQGNAGISQNF